MKKSIFVLLLFLLFSILPAGNRASVPDIFRPQQIAVSDNRLYIAEPTSILIYNLEDFKCLKRFGKRGEGPGEVKLIRNIFVKKDQLVINSTGKILLFSKDGNYIGEKRLNKIFTFSIYPLKEYYVGEYLAGNIKEDKVSSLIAFLDAEFNRVKILAQKKFPKRGKTSGKLKSEAVKDFFGPRFYEERVYIGDTRKGFYIEVIGNNGKSLYTINKKYEKLKVTEENVKDILKRSKREDRFITSLTGREVKYNIRDYFPAYRDFTVQDDRIYAFTYKTKNKKQEVIIMDLNGKELGRAFTTIAKINTIANGKYYYLKDNVEKEEWELYWEKLH